MFFILSKILSFLISPIVWIFILLIFAIVSKNQLKKRRLLILNVFLLFIFSNGFIQNEVFKIWEVAAIEKTQVGKHKVGIVLGGLSWEDTELDRIQFVRGADRLFQAVDLYENKYIEKILFTSGSGNLTRPDAVEAIPVKKYLLSIGIPDSAITIEFASKNTYENALFSAAILKSENITDTCLLITSAFHMRRGMACFEKLNIPVKAFSTDRYSGMRTYNLEKLFVPSAEVLLSWSVLMHEWVGYFTYKLMNYC
jgi:uncharacterized SAM-binding protein YcdF (DUF218 family)